MNRLFGTAALVAITIATPATAAVKLPIAGNYGNASGCLELKTGFMEKTQDPDWILVSPAGIQGHEFECTVLSVGKGTAVLSCSEAGDEGQPGKKLAASFREDRVAGQLHWTDGAGPPLALDRCK